MFNRNLSIHRLWLASKEHTFKHTPGYRRVSSTPRIMDAGRLPFPVSDIFQQCLYVPLIHLFFISLVIEEETGLVRYNNLPRFFAFPFVRNTNRMENNENRYFFSQSNRSIIESTEGISRELISFPFVYK